MIKRIKEIDFLYTLGTVLVIFGHSHSSDWSKFTGTFFETAINFIYSFHMPLFFFVAGFLFSNSKKLLKVGYSKWLVEKSAKILFPYVFLTIIFLFPKMYLDIGSWFNIDYIIKAFLQPRNNVWGHLWFLPVLFLCYAVFGAFKKAFNSKNQYILQTLLTVFCIILYFLPLNTNWFGVTDFRKSIIFFSIGMISCDIINNLHIEIKTIYKIFILLFGLLASIILFALLYKYLAIKLFISILMIVSCYILGNIIKENKLFQWVSNHNYTIYLYSWLAQSVAMQICDKVQFSWFITFLVMFAVGFICPFLIIFIYKKLPKLHNQFFDLILGIK